MSGQTLFTPAVYSCGLPNYRLWSLVGVAINGEGRARRLRQKRLDEYMAGAEGRQCLGKTLLRSSINRRVCVCVEFKKFEKLSNKFHVTWPSWEVSRGTQQMWTLLIWGRHPGK